MAARSSKSIQGEWIIEAQPVSWIRNGALRQRPLFLLAHGAGAPQTSSFMQDVALGLAARGISVVRFNFPYMERAVREGGRRPPDAAAKLLRTCRAAFEAVVRSLPTAQRHSPAVVIGGKSMGGRMMSMLLAESEGIAAAAAVYLGYPLHPPGKPQSLRVAHLPNIRVPQLFVSGTRDPLARLDLLQKTVADLPKNASLYLVEGGDHSLALRRREADKGNNDWLDAVARFILAQTRKRLAT